MTVRARWWAVGGAVILLVAAAVGAGVLWVRRADPTADPTATPTTVVLEAAGDEGADPFVAAKSDQAPPASRPHLPDTGSAAAVTATVDPDTGARTVAGTTGRLYAGSNPGNQELYGGSGSLSACDPAAIAEFLADHPDKAAAWAGVRGIESDAIAGYLDTLTPVLLLHDTLVTNHGFAGGVATPIVSVLQAGTAVLVDPTGLPVVRCACGNPLTAPPAVDLSTATLQGARWAEFDLGRTLVVAGGAAVSQLVVVDVSTGDDLTLSVGAPATPATTSSPPTTSAPTTADGSACVLDLTWPKASPGWIEPLDSTLTCQEMIDQWRRYEQWPGERGGSQRWVDFGDGWVCTTRLASEVSSAVGGCAMGADHRFVVREGRPAQTTTTPSSDGSGCTFDLTYPVGGPGWIDADDAILSCQQMADLWRRYEQAAPEQGGGTLGLVVFDESTKCASRHDGMSLYSSNLPADSSLVGECGVGVRVFRVFSGALGQKSVVAAAVTTTPVTPATAAATTVPASGASANDTNLLVTPSQNILCARKDGQFACTIKQFDFDLGDERCDGARGPIVRLDATGPSDATSCRGGFFDGISWPDPTPYGTTVKLGEISCDVEETGLTCTNPESHGFTLSRAGIKPF